MARGRQEARSPHFGSPKISVIAVFRQSPLAEPGLVTRTGHSTYYNVWRCPQHLCGWALTEAGIASLIWRLEASVDHTETEA